MEGFMRLCAADGCFRAARRRWCSDRCKHRQDERDRTGAFPGCVCAYCGEAVVMARRGQRFCNALCANRHREGVELEPALSPYWRGYLNRFDWALRERTSVAWCAAHELAPVPTSTPHFYEGSLAALLRTLET